MDAVLDRDAFLMGLLMVHNIVEPRQTLPILANVLIEAEAEALRLTATDLEVGARAQVPARVATRGAVTVSARKLSEILRELPPAPVAVKVADNAAVTLRCAGTTYRVVGLAPDDFPPVVPAAPAAWLTLDGATLREMLSQTAFAMSHDETRHALNGVLLALHEKEARLVATDGHRLAVSARAVGDVGAGVTGIIPRKAVQEVLRVLGAGEPVEIAITENQFLVRMPNFVMTARLVEGQFPNWEAVLPRAHPAKLVVARGALAAALRRMAVMAEERNKLVRFLIAPTVLRLSASSQDLGEAEEAVDIDYAGDEVVIGFNCRYVLDAISAISAEQILFEFKDGQTSSVLRGVGDEGYRCVIMPMRIQ